MSSKPEDNGQFYWCVCLNDEHQTKVMIYADNVEVTHSGALVATRWKIDSVPTVLAYAHGFWLYFYAASVITGDPINVQTWTGVYTYEERR